MIRNKFEGWCRDCRQSVPIGGGYLVGKDRETGRWRLSCAGCLFGTTNAPPPRPEPLRPIAVPACLQILGLRPPVDREAVRRKFRQLAKASHPDMGGDAVRFMVIEGAYRQALSLAGGRS